jgi:hypothetical protein
MTDFYTAFHERTNLIIQDTRKQLENYKIEVKYRDGVYRHLECRNPANEWECSFEIHTAPYVVTILGDWCKAYTLKREQDMLTEFLNTDEPNIGYWAERVQNRTSLEATEYEFVKLCLFDWLDEWTEDYMNAETLNECKRELEKWIDIDDPDIVRHLRDWEFCYRDKEGYIVETEPFRTFDYEDAFWDVWTEEWIRVCELLRWTACKVAAMEATQ